MKKTAISILILLSFVCLAFVSCGDNYITTLGYERSDPNRQTLRFKVIARIDGIQQYGEIIDTDFNTDGHDEDVRIDNEFSVANWIAANKKIRSGQTYTITSNVPCDVEIRFRWKGNTDKLSVSFY
jgi:hypothetical protein